MRIALWKPTADRARVTRLCELKFAQYRSGPDGQGSKLYRRDLALHQADVAQRAAQVNLSPLGRLLKIAAAAEETVHGIYRNFRGVPVQTV